MKVCGAVAVILLVHLAMVMSTPIHHLEARQSSDGCGPNPLVAVMSYAREFADFSPHQLLRFIETDTRAGSQLRVLLRIYDDCVRTGDGARYKKRSGTFEWYDQEAGVENELTDQPSKVTLTEANQSLLRALANHKSPATASHV